MNRVANAAVSVDHIVLKTEERSMSSLLLALHVVAAGRGEGLRPELVEALKQKLHTDFPSDICPPAITSAGNTLPIGEAVGEANGFNRREKN